MNKKFLWLTLPVLLIFTALLVGVFIYRNKIKQEQKSPETVTIYLTPTIGPTSPPIISENIDLSKYGIQVLNGSGIAGLAAKTKTMLEEKGFRVTTIGNANELTFKETVIQTSENIPDLFVDKLKNTLRGTYTVKDNQELVPPNSDSDVVIIIGSDKAN